MNGTIFGGWGLAEGEQSAEAWFTEIEAKPEHSPEIRREQNVAKQGIAEAEMGADRAAEVCREKDSAQDGRLRDGVKDHAE
jgi:hypothetical protein